MANVTVLSILHVTSLKLVACTGVQIIPAFVIQLRAVLFSYFNLLSLVGVYNKNYLKQLISPALFQTFYCL
jgi:hypothetical protein